MRSSHLHELPQLSERGREKLQQLRLHVWGVGPRCEKVEGGKLYKHVMTKWNDIWTK